MSKVVDLTGQKVGRLTVIKRKYPNNRGGRAKWLCRCECGKETVVVGADLRNGHTKSCGCLNRELTKDKLRLSYGLSSMRNAMWNYKNNAKNKGYVFELTEEQFAEITKKDCFYCGAKPSNIYKNHDSYGEYVYNGIDRIDNTRGYTIDNVVPCCKICNYKKGALTLQEFMEWIEKVYNTWLARRLSLQTSQKT